MKHKISTLCLVLIFAVTTYGQQVTVDLPASTLMPHYRLSVAYNTTTILVFPANVCPIDRGARDILAVKQPGVDNVLKLKASRRNFSPTNLHVFTADGRIYAFDVTYTDSLAATYNLTSLTASKDTSVISPVATLTNQIMNEDQMKEIITGLHDSTKRRSIIKIRHERMTMSLEDIGQKDALLFFRLKLQNRSNLPYYVNFLRCYTRDRQKARRTSIQEKELTLMYQDSITIIPGHGCQTAVIALPIFTLAGGKEGIIEACERNGGRSLVLHIHNRVLLRARSL